MKALKIAAAVVGGVVVLAIVLIAYVAATFDPEKYKPEITRLVKERTGRTLTIDGPIRLSYFPKLGVTASRVQLSEPNSERRFASLGEARLLLELMPLLSRQVVVDRVVVTGLNADLVRSKDGRLNVDDLTGRAEAGGKPAPTPADKGGGAPAVKLDVEGVEIRADHLGWHDERDGTQLKVSALQLKTGRIGDKAEGRLEFEARVDGTQPRVAAALKVATRYRLDLAAQAVSLSGLDASVSGDVPGATGLVASLKGDIDTDGRQKLLRVASLALSVKTRDGIDVSATLPKLSITESAAEGSSLDGVIKINRQGLSLDGKLALAALKSELKPGARTLNFQRFAMEFNGKQGDLALQGRVATPVSVQLDASSAQLGAIAGEVTASGPSIPNKTLTTKLDGQVALNWAKQTVASSLTARLDESTLTAKVNVAGFSPPGIQFDVNLDKLDADRYLPPPPVSGGTAGGGSGGGAKPPADPPVDLSALRGLNVQGQARVGQLTVRRVKIERLALAVRAAAGKLDVSPLSAGLYGGTLAGAATLVAASGATPNQIVLKQQLAGVNVGGLLRDLAGKDMLEGAGNVMLDVQTAGPTASALKRALNGAASVNLRDGAIKGINLAETFRKARSMVGGKTHEQGAAKGEKTDFTELTGTFQIRNGVARNDDLSAKSPFIRLGGAGDIDIGNDKMDYLAKAAIVNTAGGQGAREMADLRGVTIPVRISGPFDNLKYRVDFGAAIAETVKQQAQEKVKEKVQEQVQDRLKGLLRR